MLRRPQNIGQTGVTLIELLMAIVLLAVLLTLGLPSFREWIINMRIKNTADSVLRGLQQARAEAINHNANVSLTFADNNSWTIGCVTATTTCPASIQTSEAPANGMTVVRGDDADGAAITTYVFDATGRLTSPNIAGTYTNINIDSTAVDASVTRDLRVNISVGGVTRMCDPNVASTDTSNLRRCLN